MSHASESLNKCPEHDPLIFQNVLLCNWSDRVFLVLLSFISERDCFSAALHTALNTHLHLCTQEHKSTCAGQYGRTNMSVPKTTADNRVIITGQTDYTTQPRSRKKHSSSRTSNKYLKRLEMIP